MIWTAFTLGLLGSTHCVGMCGPLALALPLSRQERFRLMLESLYYNLGRVITYTLLGAVFGLLGQGITLAGFQKGLALGLGIALLLAALFSFNLESSLLKLPFLKTFYSWLRHKLASLLRKPGAKTLLTAGVLNGFLPCGLVYFALAGALSSSGVGEGMLFMAAFGLGTMPLMLALLWMGNIIGAPVKRRLRKVAPVLMIAFALLLIFRGLNVDIPLELRFWAEGEAPMLCH
jgi:sulfite exporter TauE/SafE